MRASKLIREFDSRDKLPIDLKDVIGFLQREQISDQIRFLGVDIDTEVMRGYIHQYEIPALAYGEPTFCADIYYALSQENDWRRLVCYQSGLSSGLVLACSASNSAWSPFIIVG